jgi:NAD+-dependent protein deacetylase sirtuin 4
MDGAWLPNSSAGVLKPAVVMFGEAIGVQARENAHASIGRAGRLLVVGSSLATYSAWRLVKQAKENGVAVGIANLGGVRGEDTLVGDGAGQGQAVVRISLDVQDVLPAVVQKLEQ